MAFELRLNSKEAAKESAPMEAEMSLACWRNRKVSVAGEWEAEGAKEDGGDEVGQESQAALAHLVDHGKEVDFLLGQQHTIGGSQM